MNKRADGERCEGVACDYLEKNGYTVLIRNYYPGGGLHGEIDIICEDEKYIVFAEVKARADIPERTDRYGRPAYAVGEAKRKNVTAAAQKYLRDNPTQKQPRLDVIEMYVSCHEGGERSFRINHIKNAFSRT